jgi:GH25 family lysozyme M1 (1,4-beta-N-acetylmuramidase)
MKIAAFTLALAGAALAAPVEKRSGVAGFDISHYQSSSYDFKGAYSAGARFVIIKATEGTDYKDPGFSAHYEGATSAGFIRGAYHFAHPDSSAGSTQAQYFHSNGGGWSKDGITLPGMLDIEYNPSGSTCYGLSQSSMTAWIKSFVDEYHSLTGRYPLIYSTANWWSECTGNTNDFHTTCPLVLADYNSSPGTIPGGWPFQTIWQYNDSYKYGGDSDTFNGSLDDLKKLATG